MGLGDAVLRIVSTNTFAIAAWRGGGGGGRKLVVKSILVLRTTLTSPTRNSHLDPLNRNDYLTTALELAFEPVIMVKGTCRRP